MRILRTGTLAALLLATAAASATAGQAPSLFQSGRYAALGTNGSLSFVVQHLQITGLQVRMPFWSSALLMAMAMLATVWVRAYFHANYLKPPQVAVVPDDALPRAA